MGCTTKGSSDSRSIKECDDGLYIIPGEKILEPAKHLADKREPQIHVNRDQKEAYMDISRSETKYMGTFQEKIFSGQLDIWPTKGKRIFIKTLGTWVVQQEDLRIQGATRSVMMGIWVIQHSRRILSTSGRQKGRGFTSSVARASDSPQPWPERK